MSRKSDVHLSNIPKALIDRFIIKIIIIIMIIVTSLRLQVFGLRNSLV